MDSKHLPAWAQVLVAVVALVASGGVGAYVGPMFPKSETPAVDPQEWIGFDDQGNRIVSDDIEAIAGRVPLGTYKWLGIPRPGQKVVNRVIVVANEGVPTPAPPIVPPAPPKPAPTPQPQPQPSPVIKTEKAYLVFIDSWQARADSKELRDMGPESDLWADVRAAGHEVVNLDIESEQARDSYPTYLDEQPVVLAFDSSASTFLGWKSVKKAADVRGYIKELTGKELP